LLKGKKEALEEEDIHHVMKEEPSQQQLIMMDQFLGGLEAPITITKADSLTDFPDSPMKAQENGEIAKQEPSEVQGKELLVVNNIPLIYNGCMWQDTKGSWNHEQKDERKHEEQENEENVGKIPSKSHGIKGIEHIGNYQ
ncbi:hypothetical protein KI387_036258, partial [Taxus chinensis]